MNAFRQEVTALLGLSETQVRSLQQEKTSYEVAFQLYEERSYRKAAHLFTTLVLSNPLAPHYWQGLASSKQMAREYEAALHAWSLVALFQPEDPLPHKHAAECLKALGEEEEAEKALRAARSLMGDNDATP